MDEIDEIMALARRFVIPFPLYIGVLDMSNKAIAESEENTTDHIVEYSPLMNNAEELEIWLNSNKNKKNIVLVPESTRKQIELKQKQKEAAASTHKLLKKRDPGFWKEIGKRGAKKRWSNEK